MEEFEDFVGMVREITTGHVELLDSEDDPLATIELNALLAAAHAFVTYAAVRAQRRSS